MCALLSCANVGIVSKRITAHTTRCLADVMCVTLPVAVATAHKRAIVDNVTNLMTEAAFNVVIVVVVVV